MRSARVPFDDEELTHGLEDDLHGGYTARSQFDGKTEYKSLKDAAMGYGKETTPKRMAWSTGWRTCR